MFTTPTPPAYENDNDPDRTPTQPNIIRSEPSPYTTDPPQPQPGASPGKVRPGRPWYLLALAVFLAGAALLVAGLLGVKDQVDGFQRVSLPQGGQVSLDHSGSYVLYYEAPGAASGQTHSFRVTVTPASPSADVRSLQPYAEHVTYVFGSREGQAVLTLQVAHAGTYRVTESGAPAVAGGSDLAVGSDISGSLVGTAVPASLLMVFGLGGAIAVLCLRRLHGARA